MCSIARHGDVSDSEYVPRYILYMNMDFFFFVAVGGALMSAKLFVAGVDPSFGGNRSERSLKDLDFGFCP